MKLLVLGGTVFVGRHIVTEALKRGHEVTLFNRGSQAGLFPEVEQLIGDRGSNRNNDKVLDIRHGESNLSALEGGAWDAVIDTSAYIPRVVNEVAEVLKKKVKQYCLISSISVYADPTKANLTEDDIVLRLNNPETEKITPTTYGGLKVLCEEAVSEHFSNSLIIRPGLVVGPHDPTDRFTYWPWRFKQGRSVLAPEPKDAAVQYIDARDMAVWTLNNLEVGTTGTFNLVNTPSSYSISDVVESCKRNSDNAGEAVWVNQDFLQQEDVKPFQDLPMFLPKSQRNFMQVNNNKAIETGLTNRLLDDTIADIMTWLDTLDDGYELKAGLRLEREQELLAKWAKQS